MMEQPLLGEGDDENAVSRGNTHAHDGAHESRNAERGVGDKEKQNNSGQGRRKCGDDDERIQPGLKIDHNQQVHQNDGKPQTTDEADVRGTHRTVLTAEVHETSPWQQLSIRFHNTVYVAADCAEIPVLY